MNSLDFMTISNNCVRNVTSSTICVVGVCGPMHPCFSKINTPLPMSGAGSTMHLSDAVPGPGQALSFCRPLSKGGRSVSSPQIDELCQVLRSYDFSYLWVYLMGLGVHG